MARVFISYRRADSGYVASMIADKLTALYGNDAVFLDIDGIPFGLDFREAVNTALAQCDVLLVVIGDEWLNDSNATGSGRLHDPADLVRIEIESALQRNIPVVPVLTGHAMMPAQSDLPETLADLAYRNAAELRPGRDFRSHADALLAAISDLTQDKEERPSSRNSRDGSPALWRRLFLLYTPQTVASKFFRVLFFLSFAFATLLAIATTQIEDASQEHGYTLMCFTIAFYYGVVYLVFWLPARGLDRRA